MIQTFNKSLICEFPKRAHIESGLEKSDEDYNFLPVARVISSPVGSSILPNEIIMFWSDRKNVIDGETQNRWVFDGKEVLQIPDNYVQAKVINEEKFNQAMIGVNVEWDHGVDTIAVNHNVLLRVIHPNEITESGLKMPTFDMGRNRSSQFAEVLSVGGTANSFFAEETLQVGQIVVLQPMPAGGDLPSKEGERIWRCPGINILAVVENGEIVPVGGNCIVEPFTLHEQVKSDIDTGFGKFESSALQTPSGLVLPSSSIDSKIFRTGKIHKCGTGWSKDYLARRGHFGAGNIEFKEGEWILLDCFNHEGKARGEVFPITMNGKSFYFMNSIIINVKLDEKVVVSNTEMRSFEIPRHHYIMNDIKPLQ